MRAGTVALFALKAASVLAAPAPQASGEPEVPVETVVPSEEELTAALLSGNPEDALSAMAALDAVRYNQIEEEFTEAEANPEKRSLFGSCSLGKLQIRREWYVFFHLYCLPT